MSKNISLEVLNGDWILHEQNENSYWTRGNYELIPVDNIFGTNNKGWMIKDSLGLEILGLKTQGNPWSNDVEIIVNPNAIYTEDNYKNFQIIALTNEDAVDLSSWYRCEQIFYDENEKVISWNGKRVNIRKNENNEIKEVVFGQMIENLKSNHELILVGNIYNIDTTAQLFIYPQIGINTTISQQLAATSDDVLIGKQFFVNSKRITGTMPLSVNEVTKDFWKISYGYLKENINLSVVNVEFEQNKVIIKNDGYIQSDQIIIPPSTPSQQNNKTTLSEGYLLEPVTYITTTNFITATSDDILEGKVSMNQDGEKIIGTIKSVSPINDVENKLINIDKGYLSSSFSYPDYECVTSTPNNVLKGTLFINQEGTWSQGLIETIDSSSISVNEEKSLEKIHHSFLIRIF